MTTAFPHCSNPGRPVDRGARTGPSKFRCDGSAWAGSARLSARPNNRSQPREYRKGRRERSPKRRVWATPGTLEIGPDRLILAAILPYPSPNYRSRYFRVSTTSPGGPASVSMSERRGAKVAPAIPGFTPVISPPAVRLPKARSSGEASVVGASIAPRLRSLAHLRRTTYAAESSRVSRSPDACAGRLAIPPGGRLVGGGRRGTRGILAVAIPARPHGNLSQGSQAR